MGWCIPLIPGLIQKGAGEDEETGLKNSVNVTFFFGKLRLLFFHILFLLVPISFSFPFFGLSPKNISLDDDGDEAMLARSSGSGKYLRCSSLIKFFSLFFFSFMSL